MEGFVSLYLAYLLRWPVHRNTDEYNRTNMTYR